MVKIVLQLCLLIALIGVLQSAPTTNPNEHEHNEETKDVASLKSSEETSDESKESKEEVIKRPIRDNEDTGGKIPVVVVYDEIGDKESKHESNKNEKEKDNSKETDLNVDDSKGTEGKIHEDVKSADKPKRESPTKDTKDLPRPQTLPALVDPVPHEDEKSADKPKRESPAKATDESLDDLPKSITPPDQEFAAPLASVYRVAGDFDKNPSATRSTRQTATIGKLVGQSILPPLKDQNEKKDDNKTNNNKAATEQQNSSLKTPNKK